jgi:SAM-dependent methyltransferase
MDVSQIQLDKENSNFWNELCGTVAAQRLGITDSSKESLAKFDSWYLDFYPYLLPIAKPERMKGKKVLEIGLGYGTLGEQLAKAGADYTGMDIAQNPVDHMNYRLRMHGLPGRANQGSALAMPFPDDNFDFVVSIGCMHHTGDVAKCFEETYRVLKPGGIAVLMIYNKYSYMRWRRAPLATLRSALGWLSFTGLGSEKRRADYDPNSEGKAAPEVSLLSIHEIKRMLHLFEAVTCAKQNANELAFKGVTLIPRSWLLSSLGRLMGLDIYIEARKDSTITLSNAAA